MRNMLFDKVEYKIEKTRHGIWRRHLNERGAYFAEYTSYATFLGWPLVHYTRGISPETGRRVTARGVIAVGRLAVGGLAIGHASFGLIAIGQAGLGLLFGLGQAATGLFAVGQLALGGGFGLGQIATGQTAVGQLAFGEYVLAQLGVGDYLWTPEQADAEAVSYFKELWSKLKEQLLLR